MKALGIIALTLLASLAVACGGDGDAAEGGGGGGATNTSSSGSGRPEGPSVEIVELPETVAAGDDVTLTVGTPEGTACVLRVLTPFRTDLNAEGLGSGTADASGQIAWTWTMPETVPNGSFTVDVTCGSTKVTQFFKVAA
ncbi:MAG: hypothetical protein GEU80_01345 [Dehalococcoidia bacterium]|nr:hypothetical protein [Dehalococcoidia bacterium]